MEQIETDLDEREDESIRRRVESAILVCVIGVPVLLGIIGNGLGHPIATRATDLIFDFIVWPYSFSIAMLTTTTLLLSWRYPLISGSSWKPILIAVSTLTLPSFLFLAVNLWNDPTRYIKSLVWMATVDLMQWSLVLTGALMLFVLIRRTTGLCFVAGTDVAKLRPISIAELLYWVTACAVLFAVVPWIIAQTPWSQAGWSLAYYPHLASRILDTAVPTLSVVLTARWRWSIPILIAIAIILLLQLIAPTLYYLLYSTSIQIAYVTNLTNLMGAIISAAGIALAIWLMERRGCRCVRVSRKRVHATAESVIDTAT